MKHNGLRHLTQKERAALDELIARLRKKFRKRLVRVILFGSKARGDEDAESDIDLLVVVKPNGEDWKEYILKNETELDLDRSVSLSALKLTDEEFRTMQKRRAPLYRSIRNEGISVYPRVGKYSRVPLEVNGGVENVDENKRIQIKMQLEKAREALDDAQATMKEGRMFVAVNRAYYAVFIIATASLFILDVVRAKHYGVKSAFGEFFVKKGRVEPEYAEIFNRAFDLRLEADYATEYKKLNLESAKQIVADAERFVTRMERYLHEVGAID